MEDEQEGGECGAAALYLHGLVMWGRMGTATVRGTEHEGMDHRGEKKFLP